MYIYIYIQYIYFYKSHSCIISVILSGQNIRNSLHINTTQHNKDRKLKPREYNSHPVPTGGKV